MGSFYDFQNNVAPAKEEIKKYLGSRMVLDTGLNDAFLVLIPGVKLTQEDIAEIIRITSSLSETMSTLIVEFEDTIKYVHLMKETV